MSMAVIPIPLIAYFHKYKFITTHHIHLEWSTVALLLAELSSYNRDLAPKT